MDLNNLKIAIVYDRVNKFGGAERVLLSFHEMFPKALLYTSVYDPKKASWASVFSKIYTTFLQKIPILRNYHELMGWLMPIAFETYNFDNYDLVISVTSEAAKGIITGTKTLHVCYMLTPTRYLWSHYESYFKGSTFKGLTKPIVNYLRWWDEVASKRPDKIIAISTEVKRRIKKYYDRDSEIIFPPVNSPEVALVNHPRGGIYYLYVGRLVGYKKVDLLIETFNDLGLPLVVVGIGAELSKLKRKAHNNIKFLCQVTDKELVKIYQGAKALIMPQIEDFGITSVEAQGIGVPVIAYNKGGAMDTVIPNKTGIFFNNQTKESLKQAIAKFDTMRFNNIDLINNAKNFSKEKFKRKLQRSLVRSYSSWWRRNTSLASI